MEKLLKKQDMNSDTGLVAVIVGGSGATGREFIRTFAQYEKCSKVYVITRRVLEEWDTNEQIKEKISIIKLESLDNLAEAKNQLKDVKIDVFVCMLGAIQKNGKENFVKVDFTYCVESAKLAKDLGVPHFLLETSSGANADSMFLYMKTKGQTENAIKKLEFPILTIARPGFLVNRENDERFIEKIGWCFACCVASINIKALGKAFVERALEVKNMKEEDSTFSPGNVVLDNKQLVQFSKW